MANIEKYRKPYESEEHWEQRQRFLKMYHGQFAEARLLCLAQVYANMVLLGCTYPREVEAEVNNLIKDFPKKDSKRPSSSICQVAFVRSEDTVEPPYKTPRLGSSSLPMQQPSSSSHENREFILLEDDTSNPYNTLIRAANFNNSRLNIEYEDLGSQPSSFKCIVKLDDSQIGEGTGWSKAISRESALKVALENLRPRVHVVRIKASMYKSQVSHTNITNPGHTDEISSDNVGFKLLQMMGWKGGGIGKGESIPIGVKDIYKGQGLGYRPDNKLKHCHIKTFLANYMNSNSTADLVFSADFSKDERATIHKIASQLKLRSHSKGVEGKDRHLVISRKFTPTDLLSLLKKSGGVTDKYELIPPSV